MKFGSKIFVLVILVAAILRIYNLSSVPPSPSLDEVSIGYNAFSILKTSVDEYGNRFPLLLRAYDDWRPALYVYLVIPFIEVLGFNVTAVRMPSVILSMLTVIATYFLLKELFKDTKYRLGISELTILFLAISPWHIYISRLGHEVNAGLSFFVFALLFFFRKNYFLSLILFSLSFMSYQAEKIFIPLILFILLILFKKEVWEKKKDVFFGVLFSLILLLSFINETLSPNALIRFKATNIFNANSERFEKQALLLSSAYEKNDLIGKIVYNRRVLAAQIVTEGYLSHFDPKWIFTNSGMERFKAPGIGLLFILEAPLFFIGILVFIFSKVERKIKMFIISWFLIAPLAASVTTDVPHAMRSYTFLPVLQIFTAIGIFFLKENLKNSVLINGFYWVFIMVIVINITLFYKAYFLLFPKTQSGSFQYALSQSVNFVLSHQGEYNKIVFSNQENLYQSYMFFLFFNKYDPILYQKEGGSGSGGFAQTHHIGKYEFRPINWTKEKKEKTLYVGNIKDFPQSEPFKAVFSNMDENPVIEIIEKK